MITKILYSDCFLGVVGDNKTLQIFIAIIYTPVALLFDFILLPIEVLSWVIVKILGSDKE